MYWPFFGSRKGVFEKAANHPPFFTRPVCVVRFHTDMFAPRRVHLFASTTVCVMTRPVSALILQPSSCDMYDVIARVHDTCHVVSHVVRHVRFHFKAHCLPSQKSNRCQQRHKKTSRATHQSHVRQDNILPISSVFSLNSFPTECVDPDVIHSIGLAVGRPVFEQRVGQTNPSFPVVLRNQGLADGW